MLRYIIFILLLTGMVSCGNQSTNSEFSAKALALGKVNEIVVIADDDIWSGAVGDSIRYYFESAYPVMPAPEPLFDLRHFTVQDLSGEPLRRDLRTYLIVANLGDEESPTTQMVRKDLGEEKYNEALSNDNLNSTVGKDKWARGQMLAYLFAPTEEKLKQTVRSKFSSIANRVTEHDREAINASIYAVTSTNKGLSRKVSENMNYNIDLPADFITVIDEEDGSLLWVKKDIKESIYNIVIQKIAYTEENQLTKDSIIAYVNKFGKKYVESTTEGSYLVINDIDLPVNEYELNIYNGYGREYRGIWEMTEDFYGGPFASYLMLEEGSQDIILITTFILAPGKDKRDYMMQLDHIVKKSYY